METETQPIKTEVQTSKRISTRKFFLILAIVLGVVAIFTAIFVTTRPKYDMRNPQATAEKLQAELVSSLELLTDPTREAELKQTIQKSNNASATVLFEMGADTKLSSSSTSVKVSGAIAQSASIEEISFALNVSVKSIPASNADATINFASDFNALYFKYDTDVNASSINEGELNIKKDTWYKASLSEKNKQEVSNMIKQIADPEVTLKTVQTDANTRIYKAVVTYLKGKQLLTDGKYTQDKVVFGQNIGCAEYNLDLGIIIGNAKQPLELCLNADGTTGAANVKSSMQPNQISSPTQGFDIFFSYSAKDYSPVEMPSTYVEDEELTTEFNKGITEFLPQFKQGFNQGGVVIR